MVTFIKNVITRVKNRSPDMILVAFDVKFHEKKDEIPPRACRPPNKLNKNHVEKVGPKKLKKNNVEKVGSYILIYLHIPSYTFIYVKIALYTFIYPHIHQNIQY